MRTNNLIQAYVNGQPAVQQYNSNKTVKDFDVHKELSNRTFIKPLKSHAKLVRPSLFDMPAEMVKGVSYDIKALGHAINGKANDHELGRLNNIGMKAGGLAIASYLFTRKSTLKTKVFEFIGFASFFAAMDLWPKIFLQLPAYLVHGINVREKYIDNEHKKKMVALDPQFEPLDLYKDSEINKLGDKNGVPKDMPNRRAFVEEWYHKVALQNNTIWMLSSGFATPLLSALICNRLEKPVSEYLHNYMNKKSDALLDNFDQEIQKFDFTNKQQNLDNLLREYTGQPFTEARFKALHSAVSEGLDPLAAKALEQDLRAKFRIGEHFTVSKQTLTEIQELLKNKFSAAKLTSRELAQVLPDSDTILKTFEERGLLTSNIKDFSAHVVAVQDLLDENISKIVSQHPKSIKAKTLEFIMDSIIHGTNGSLESDLTKVLKKDLSKVLTEESAGYLKSISLVVDELKRKTNVLDKYAFIKTAKAEDTILADLWNNTTSGFMKALKFTPAEFKMARIDSEIAGKVLRNKVEDIVSDKKACAELVENLGELLSNVYRQTKSLILDQDNNLYKSLVEQSFETAAEDFRNKGLRDTVYTLVGFDKSGKTSLKNMYLETVSDRVISVKSSFYRLLQMVDTYYKIAHVENVDGILTYSMPREVKEEMVELAKSTLLEGHTSDFSTKLYQKRNPSPAKNDYSQIETRYGKVINLYYGKKTPEQLIEYPNDRHYFSNVMKLMFGGEMHPDLEAKLCNSVFYDDFKAYKRDVIQKLGGEKIFSYPNVLVDGQHFEATSKERFNRLGCALNEMTYKLCNSKFNSHKWFSTFGKLGAAVIGATLLSQFFLGRMKLPQQEKEVK